MFSVFSHLLATLTVLLSWFNVFDRRKLKPGEKRLPGPRGYPLFGNILDIGKHPEKQFDKWRQKYGDIYGIKAANYKVVVVSDLKAVKEIMSDSRTNGRLLPWGSLYENTPHFGLFPAEGELYAAHRRFLIRQLREFGFGKSSMESLLMHEVKAMIKIWRQDCGKNIGEIRETLRLAVVNGLWSILTGHRFQLSDEMLKDLADNTTKRFDDVLARGAILLFVPWIRHILPGLSGYQNIRDVYKKNQHVFEKTVREHQDNFNEHQLNDFIDVYLAEMKKNQNNPDSHFYGEAAIPQLVTILFNLFVAGSDTTAMSTAWAILYLCKFPKIQEKLQAEISKATDGDTRYVTLSDRPHMPYATAVVDEVYRHSSIAAFGLPHRVREDMIFHGYLIEENTQIIANLFHIHHSAEIWGDPENFRPERFLSDDGRKFVKNENLIPFLIGKRVCPGESLARDNVFLYVTNFFQAFSMRFDPAEKEPGYDAPPGFLRGPYPFKVIMTDRMPAIEEKLV